MISPTNRPPKVWTEVEVVRLSTQAGVKVAGYPVDDMARFCLHEASHAVSLGAKSLNSDHIHRLLMDQPTQWKAESELLARAVEFAAGRRGLAIYDGDLYGWLAISMMEAIGNRVTLPGIDTCVAKVKVIVDSGEADTQLDQILAWLEKYDAALMAPLLF